MAKLVIVESPAKAKTIGKYLGPGYKVTASMGHVRDLPASQLGIDVEHGYTPKYITIKGKQKLVKELKTEAKKADGVLLATDPDREGEAISWHLANLLGLDPAAETALPLMKSPKKACRKAWPTRVPLTWICSTPSRPGGNLTVLWATSSARFCGEKYGAGFRPAVCRAWRCG